jgi:hypothetical protein
LLSGGGEWGGSLLWSALAVMPWFALFELSKTEHGRRLGSDPLWLALSLVATAALSLALELGWHALRGHPGSPIGLTMMRRLPAIGASLILILWVAAAFRREVDEFARSSGASGNLSDFADSIDWIAAADNYVELHMAGRVVLRRMTMREAERALEQYGFVRIHRRFLVNCRRIDRIVGSNGDRCVRLGETELPVGSRYAARLER